MINIKENEYKKFIKRQNDYIRKISVYCKCGHSVQYITRKPYIKCNYCGRLIFKNKKCEYDFYIKRRFNHETKSTISC